MDGAAPNLQDVLRLRQQDAFVGRDARLSEFRDNLRLPPLHPDRRYIVNVHGIAGVGKSFLLQQFRRIADAEGAASALVNEDYFDVVDTMAALAAGFAAQDARLTGFEDRLAAYRRRRRELEGDPEAPLGDLVTTTTVRAGMALAKTVPVAGAVAEFVDPDAVAGQANRLRAYLVRRFGKQADIDLLLSPVDALTTSFAASLSAVAEDRTAVLCFDTFERTAPYLESWLLDLFSGRFGGLSANVVTVVAGQFALADNRWSPLRTLIAAHPLEPFTDTEARGFLAQRGITGEAVVEVILPLSGRIPMWLATLAARSPQDPGSVPDPSEDAVERFLQWEPDEQRKRLAKAAALPRRFNRDALLAIPAAGAVDDLLAWLLQLPFVSRAGDYWRYHDAVRDPMLRLARVTSPQRWREQHRALVAHFAQEQAALGLAEDRRRSDPQWQSLAVEEHYHRLCAAPGPALQEAFGAAVDATEEGVAAARQWAAMLTEAGAASGSERLRSWGERLTGLLKDRDDDTAFLTALIDSGELTPGALADALSGRGESHRFAGRYEQALADLDRAVAMVPGRARFHRRRGLVHQALRRFDESLEDLTRAVDLDPSPATALLHRGLTYRIVNRDAEAMADFDRAVALEPGNPALRRQRGIEHRLGKRYDAAIADFDRAIALEPENPANIEERGVTHQLTGRYDDALADFGAAIAADPENDSAIAQRGYTLFLMGRSDEALRDLDRALELNARASWTYGLRGGVRADLGQTDLALADYDRAIELDPYIGMPYTERGSLLHFLGRDEEAIADLDRAIALDSADETAYLRRGSARYRTGRYGLALEDFGEAVARDPGNDLALTERGRAYRALERYEEAVADFTRAAALAGDEYWDLVERAETYRLMGRFADALADLDRAVALAPDRATAYERRGRAYRDLGRCAEARDDFDRAVARDPEFEAAIAQRGEMHRVLGDLDAALADLDRAVELEPDDPWNRGERGLVHLLRGDPDAAAADLAPARNSAQSSSWWRYVAGLVAAVAGDGEEAAAAFAAAAGLGREEIAADPAEGFLRTNLVLYLLLGGDAAAARLQLRDVLESSPGIAVANEFHRELSFLAACPGLDVAGVEEFTRAVAAYLDGA
ncbi:tetratricopeptide repeat protein [Glycomyces scopariae]